MKKHMRSAVLVLVFATCVMTGAGYAAVTLTDIGITPPTPGPYDISQLLTNGNKTFPDNNRLNYYTDNSYKDGTAAGQTFTTTSTSTNLISVAIRTAGLDSGNITTPPNYLLRLYSVSGSSATLVTNLSAPTPAFVDGHWLKWNNLNVALAPNSNYAFSFARGPMSSGYSWCALAVATNTYSNGEIAMIPTNGGTMLFGSSHNFDAVFDLGMKADAPTANTPLISPKSTVYIGQTVTLTESALGATPLYYQWQTDGGGGGSLTNIPAANATYLLVTPSNAGVFRYDVVVTNAAGSATSGVVTITILPPAAVAVNTAQPMATMPLEGLGVASAVYFGLMTSSGAPGSVAAAGIKAVRYPGGSYADIFHWQTYSGCGGYLASGDDFNSFINDLVTPAGATAIITVNYGSNPACNGGGDTNEAAAWVAYANVANHLGIKYWEIGNEQYGNGYYNTNGWEEDLHYPASPVANRVGQPALSPTAYGSNAAQFITAMKAQDTNIQCGVVFNTGYPNYSTAVSYNNAVLGQCGNVADFVIIHWYPNDLFASAAQVVSTINDTRTQLTNILGAARAGQMGIAATETGAGNYTGSPAALFAADNFLTWIENGAINVDYQELDNGFLGNSGINPGVADNTLLGPAYGAKMSRLLADVGDTMLKVTSAESLLHVHATARQDGKTGVMLINTDPNIPIPVAVNISGPTLASSGTCYQFGLTNFISANIYPSYPISTNTVSGLGNSFTVSVPPYTIVELLIPPAPNNTPPVLSPIGNQTVNVGQTVAFTASATDTDSPPQTLTFSLVSGPGNATLTTNSGAFSWRPTVTSANTTNAFTLTVADNGSPILSATQSFSVTVNPLTQPTAGSIVLNNGQLGFQVSGQTGPDYAVQGSTNLTAWNTLFITNSPPMPFSWTDTNAAILPAQFYRIKVGPPLP
jgi:Putative Ig domain